MNIDSFVDAKPNPRIPAFRPGDTVRVHAKVVESGRERIQAFEGVVIRIRRGGINSSFTVRRISHGVGVERVFPYYSPLVDKVDVVRVGSVRRAKLYYLRDRVGKAARIKAGARARFEELTSLPPEAFEETEEPGEEAPEEPGAQEEAPGETEEKTDELTETSAGEAPEPAAPEAVSEEMAQAEAEAEAEAVAQEPAPEEAAPGSPAEPAGHAPDEEKA